MMSTPSVDPSDKRVSLQKHSEKLYTRLEELKQKKTLKPKQKQPEISVAQILLERLKHNMDQESPNFQSLQPTNPEAGKFEVVKIGALMQTVQQEQDEKEREKTATDKLPKNSKQEITEPKIINKAKQ